MALRDGDFLTVGDRYRYENSPAALFPQVGKTHRFATVGRFGPWALDQATGARMAGDGGVIEFLDGARCRVEFSGRQWYEQIDVSCTCSHGDTQCPHALGAVYTAGGLCRTVGGTEIQQQLSAALERAGETTEAVDFLAAADCGYVFVRQFESMWFTRGGVLAPADDPRLPVIDLAEALFG